ncbi:50S ribosomal protein L10, partial [Synechococcus sp. WH 5701]
LKGLLAETELALVLDFKGLSIKEMSDCGIVSGSPTASAR